MTRREKLIEQYEDALFAVIMNDIAEREGEELLKENERLMADPGAAVPEAADKRCLRTISRAFRRKRAKAVLKTAGRVVNVLGCVALTVNVLFGTAYAAFPEFRVAALNLLIETSNVATRLTMAAGEAGGEYDDYGPGTSAPQSGDGMLLGYELPPLPEGFELVYEDIEGDAYGAKIFEKDENRITITVSKQNSNENFVDTEKTEEGTPTYVGLHEAFLVVKDDRIQITVFDNQRGYDISFICCGLDEQTVIYMAAEMVN